jgi:uncharacterized protein (DUF1499 family)
VPAPPTPPSFHVSFNRPNSPALADPTGPWRGGLVALLLSLTLLLGVPGPAVASLLHLEGPVPADLGVRDGHLATCGSPAHCAREDWPVADPIAALGQLLPALLALEDVELVESGPDYLHAIARSRLFGFVDDLELHAAPGAGVIEARSVSRLGDSDLGVNARRLERLRRSLQPA